MEMPGKCMGTGPCSLSGRNIWAIPLVFLSRRFDPKGATRSLSPTSSAAQSPLARGRHDLIGSDRVEGTNVYRSDGKKIGEIERVMIDKISGHAAYAVTGFGGFTG